MISPYTAPDVLLGVFNSPAQAEAARLSYISDLKHRADPWERQAFKPTIEIEEDVDMLELPVVQAIQPYANSMAFIISVYVDGSGLIVRKFRLITDSGIEAQKIISKIKSSKEFEDYEKACLNAWCHTQAVAIGVLLPDARSKQPKF